MMGRLDPLGHTTHLESEFHPANVGESTTTQIGGNVALLISALFLRPAHDLTVRAVVGDRLQDQNSSGIRIPSEQV